MLDGGGKWVNTYDGTGASAELWRSEHYDASNNLLQRTVTNDDGTHALTIYDAANAYSWAGATITFDAAWNRTGFGGTTDSGTGTVSQGSVNAEFDTLAWFKTPYDANNTLTPIDPGQAVAGGARSKVRPVVSLYHSKTLKAERPGVPGADLGAVRPAVPLREHPGRPDRHADEEANSGSPASPPSNRSRRAVRRRGFHADSSTGKDAGWRAKRA